ncbi:MAG: hypothetical protein ABI051_05000 [Vicinamibacterales bacterium]
MNDQQLRALVRDAVARRLGARSLPAAGDVGCGGSGPAPPMAIPAHDHPSHHGHPSHHVYLTVINTTEACVIEPSVMCDHCGYCKSHGH